jgi:cobalt-zinc-cadmium resistance protein CzcA
VLSAIVRWALGNRLLVIAGAAMLVLAGGVAARNLPIDAVPDVTNVQVQIITAASALSPLEVEQYVTAPVERALGGIPAVTELRSTSRYGLSTVTAVFRDGTDIYFARQQISERMREITDAIPERYGRPEVGPISTGLGEIYQFVLRGKGHSLMELKTLLDWELMVGLRMVPGIVEVNTFGGEDKQYEVRLDPARMAAVGVGLTEVFEALARNNANAGGGYIERNRVAILIRSEGLIGSLDDLRGIVVNGGSGAAPVTVGSLGTVSTAPRLRRGAATMDGEGEVVLGVALMLMGENSRTVTERVKARLDELRKTLPQGVSVEPYYDRSALVDRTIRTATHNLIVGAILVIIVLFLLLGRLRAGLIVASAIPLAMLAAIIGMWASGSSGNLMSLGAIDFGLIVDGSVIIIENASRRLSEKREELRRALTAAERSEVIAGATTEVRRASVFGEAIIAIVYVPVLLLSGMEGKLFRPMAATLLFALGGAFVLSLTLIPVLASFFLHGEPEREPILLRSARRAFTPVIRTAQRHPGWVVGTGTVAVVAALVGFQFLGAEFIPTLEEGSFLIQVRRLPGTALSSTIDSDLRIGRALREVPEVTKAVSRIGQPSLGNEAVGIESSEFYVSLAPQSKWRPGKDKEALAAEIEKRIEDAVPEVAVAVNQPIHERTNELIAGFRSDAVLSIYGDDLNVLRGLAARATELLRSVPGVADLKPEQIAGQPYLRIVPDRNRLARFGLTVDDVNAATETLSVGHEVGHVFEGQRRYPLVVREDASDVAGLVLRGAGGQRVPLREVAEVTQEQGPSQISREGGVRRITVEMNVRGRDTVGFVEEAQARLGSGLELPPGYRTTWGGQYQHYQAARARLLVVVPAALALILLLLYLAFHEVSPALLIFLNVPFGITGGVAALALRGLPFSISAGVGFIALFGVAVLNGLVLLSVAHQREAEGMDPAQAAFAAAEDRLRPVLMTALVAILGFIPMAISTAPGAEVQRPLATVVIGGLISATLLTLFVLPTVYGLLRSRPARR